MDLLLIPRKSFDEILRDTLLAEWDVLQDALVHFNYFKNWDVKTIRECCILSRMKNFLPDEVLISVINQWSYKSCRVSFAKKSYHMYIVEYKSIDLLFF